MTKLQRGDGYGWVLAKRALGSPTGFSKTQCEWELPQNSMEPDMASDCLEVVFVSWGPEQALPNDLLAAKRSKAQKELRELDLAKPVSGKRADSAGAEGSFSLAELSVDRWCNSPSARHLVT